MTEESEYRKAEADRWWSFREKSIEHSKEYGISTIRSLTLINGGAIIAILTFVANLKNDKANVDISGLKCSMVVFALGLLLAVAAGAMGYFNFGANASVVPGPNELRKYTEAGDVTGWKNYTAMINATAIVAVVLVALSFVMFFVGSLFAINSLTSK